MVRRAFFSAVLAVLFVANCDRPAAAAPIKLARHPDYHAGKIAFSYLGDIWTANEDGTAVAAPHRQHRARDLPALLARRPVDRVLVEPLRQQRRLRRPRRRRHAAAADLPHRQRRSGRLDARFAAGASSAPRAATARSRTSRCSTRCRSTGGMEKPLPVDWGYWGSFSPDGKSLVFNRHPAVWSRQHYRGSYAADLWIADLAAKTYTKLLGDERYNRYWPMWGADDAIYFVADPLPNDKSVEAGQPRRPQERQQHLQDSGTTAASRCR